ncbi:uncharacterized protein LOC122075884 [Macadamia integrifolia]|uniref:uncharacterized protein LOC122075884 n=1 Tax=Macadamia integrifolia TaxID=60698 RepID=UPI001C4F16DF|nr:uncharacterized protein LOC122075884 [Macadamia integrifolia]
MVGSCLDSMDAAVKANNTIKFLYSYGGKILPRYPDGKLRYVGGDTRVLAVDRFISFAELLVKFGELYGSSVSLRCQLPTEDLDALVSITSDEDLANLIEEYDRASMCRDKKALVAVSSPLKIRGFLFPRSVKKVSPPPSTTSSTINDATAAWKSPNAAARSRSSLHRLVLQRCLGDVSTPMGFPVQIERSTGRIPYYAYQAAGTPRHSSYLVHNRNHWQ